MIKIVIKTSFSKGQMIIKRTTYLFNMLPIWKSVKVVEQASGYLGRISL